MGSNTRLLVLGAIIALMTSCTHARNPLYDWMRASASPTYRTPSPEESAALAGAFARAMSGRGARGWEGLGYEVLSGAGEEAVRESPPAQRGWGTYVFRTGPARALVVQAPHSESDLGTGEIAFVLYRQSGARMLAMNSAHRSLPQADQAHGEHAPFALLGREAARPAVDAVVVQVHGYGRATADRHGLPPEAVVISNGTRVADGALRASARCLANAGFVTRIFPDEAGYPGGTRNTVGAAVAASGAGRFVHLELGDRLRDSLLHDSARLRAFGACL